MTTITGKSGKDLLAAVKRAGWSYRTTTGGQVLVTAPGGTFRFDPRSTSRARGHENALAEARRLGLDQALAAADARDAAARRDRLAAARAKAPHVPGPFAVAQPGADIHTATVTVTPRWARDRLAVPLPNLPDGSPLRPRRLDPALVAAYAREMTAGRWLPASPQGIALTPNKAVLDGRHRLHALALAQVTVPMQVTYNVPPAYYAHLDTGWRRSAATVLGMRHTRPGLAAAAKLLACYLAWDTGNGPDWPAWPHQLVTNGQVCRILADHPGLADSSQATHHLARVGVARAAATVWHYLAGRAWPDRHGHARRDEFLCDLADGVDLVAGDPAHTLRGWLADRADQRREAHLAALIAGWNRHCSGQTWDRVDVDGMHRPYTPR